MFEVARRHSPVFRLSDVRTVGQALQEHVMLPCWGEADARLTLCDPSVTARINELCPQIVRSERPTEEVRELLESRGVIARLQDSVRARREEVLLRLAISLGRSFGLGVLRSLGSPDVSPDLQEAMSQALVDGGGDPGQPLLVMGAGQPSHEEARALAYADHPVLWLDASANRMAAVEADMFFALAPSLVHEHRLNRFAELWATASLAVGMVRF